VAAPGGILALDLAGDTGWAYGHVHDRTPDCGVIRLPRPAEYGERVAAIQNELERLCEDLQPQKVIIEAALPLAALAGHTTFDTVRQQFAFNGAAHAAAWRVYAAREEISADVVRTELLGRCRLTKREQDAGRTMKDLVTDYCRQRGWKPPDHNAADALMIWAWHVGRLRGTRPVSGPLFQERALQ
jgi:Holliday junction resolvasome RuvABC endonuclease subunit